MKKLACVCLVLALLLSCLPIIGGAGAVLYTPDDSSVWTLTNVDGDTFFGNAKAVFTAEGVGTVTIPETTVSATGGDGVRVRILKEGVEVFPYIDVTSGESVKIPAIDLHVGTGDEITFETDDRAVAGDIAKWKVSVAYTGGIAEAEALVNFIDLNNHWAKPYVLPLAEEGIVKGKTANTFDPDGQITRAEFLTLALKVANLPTEIYKESYADVTANQWFAKVAHTTKKADIVDPAMITDNSLRPDAPILREEMTAVMMRLINVMRGTTVDPAHNFTDAATFADWANDYIGKAAKLGIVTGNPDGSFNAKGSATRGEAAVMFSRLKKFLEDTPLFTPAGEYSPVYDAIVYEGVDLHKMINDAYAAGQKEITIAPGAYRIKTQPKNGHIRLIGMKDFTINAQGVTLLLQTYTAVGIVMGNCENVTINGFNIDWEKGTIAQGQIYNIDPDGYYLDIAVEPGTPHDFHSGKMYNEGMSYAYYDGETLNQITDNGGQIRPQTQIEQLGPNTYRLNGKKIAGGESIKVGDWFAARAYKTTAATSLSNCKNCTFNGLRVWSALSTLNDSWGEGGSTYNDVRLERGPKPLGTISTRVVSTQGDGIHCTALRKGPQVTNSVFSHQLDDGTNIHGTFAKIAGFEGNKVILALKDTPLLYWPGDDVRVYGPDTVEKQKLTVKTAEEYADASGYKPSVNLNQAMGSSSFSTYRYIAVTFEEKPNFNVGDWVINRSWTSGGFLFRDCVFTNSAARSLLIKSSDGIIENCEVSYGAGYGLWIAPEFNWMESGYSENVIVRNCTFHHNGWEDRETSAGLSISGEAGQDHENIVVENCTFYDNYCADLHMSDGIRFAVKNCTFKDSAINATRSIEAWNLTDVTLSGNVFEGDRKDKIYIADTVKDCKQI